MDADKSQGQIAEVVTLIRKRLGIRGRSLERQLPRVRRHIPKHLRADLERFADVERYRGHPRLMQMVDQAELDAAFARLRPYFRGIDVTDRIRGRVLGGLASLAFNLILFAVGLYLFLRWQGIV